MSFLADENFPRPAVNALRQAGFDVQWVAESLAGVSDDEVLASCTSSQRTLLTFDKDFGELAYRRKLPAECGIVLFRIMHDTPNELALFCVSALQSQQSWAGHFNVITRQRIRIRPLPSPGASQPKPAN